MARAKRKEPTPVVGAVAWIAAIVVLGSAIGWLARPDAWFTALDAPPWTPPGWVFAPVWTVLYALMGLSGWLLWSQRDRSAAARSALLAFVVQLGLNLSWSPLFFGLHRPDLAMMDIALLWVAILVLLRLAAPVSRAAALLQLPYLAWVTFAAGLNLSFWLRNG